LNRNITILLDCPIVNSKASERYVSVRFTYEDYVWEGYVPIEYRRTGTSIDFDDKEILYPYLNMIYVQMKTDKITIWKEKQAEFWNTKPKATITKGFFDALAEGGWKCGACEAPRNANPQRRIQDLKEFGYTIATALSRDCPHCGKKTNHRILLPITRGGNQGNGYETWTPALRKKMIKAFGSVDAYEDASSPHCLPDHKFPEIRWDDETKGENPETMTNEEIRQKFQLLTNQRNQQKREVCRTCFQTGKRGYLFGIQYYHTGSEDWDPNIPAKGKKAELGCVGCGWYDIAEWRRCLLLALSGKGIE
jgi:hypothetical protein